MPTPRLGTTAAPMEDFDSVEDYVQYLVGIIVSNFRELDWLTSGNLDVHNIKAKSITADRMSVKKLSAIAADLGTITAGTVIGALIKTAIDGQRVELSSVENLLKAINTDGHFISILPDISGSPAIQFKSGLAQLLMFMAGNSVVINSVGSTDISLSSTSDLGLFCGVSGMVTTNSWSKFYSSGDGETLQEALSSLSARISALEAP